MQTKINTQTWIPWDEATPDVPDGGLGPNGLPEGWEERPYHPDSDSVEDKTWDVREWQIDEATPRLVEEAARERYLAAADRFRKAAPVAYDYWMCDLAPAPQYVEEAMAQFNEARYGKTAPLACFDCGTVDGRTECGALKCHDCYEEARCRA